MEVIIEDIILDIRIPESVRRDYLRRFVKSSMTTPSPADVMLKDSNGKILYVNPGLALAIQLLVCRGEKIQAIKCLRTAFNGNILLKEAKEMVEYLPVLPKPEW